MYNYLVIDDEYLIRKGTIKKLSALADQITCIDEAENGKEATEKIEALKPDFVIMDMQMPVMGGMELLPYLSEHYPEMPLIVISGYRDFDYVQKAISANAIEYILKPFSAETIQKTVLQVIQKLDNTASIQNQLTLNEQELEETYYERDTQMLYNLIMGYRVSSSTLTSRKLNFINGTHNLVLLTLHTEKNLSVSPVQSWLEDHGFGDLALYISNPDNEHLGAVILFLPHQTVLSEKKLVSDVANALIDWMQSQGSDIYIGISSRQTALEDLHTAYDQSAAALNHRKINDSTQRIYTFEQEIAPRDLVWPSSEEMLFRIEAGSNDEVTSLTDALFSWYSTLPGCTIADIKYCCYQLSEQCRVILNRYLKTPSMSNSMQNVITHLFSVDELHTYYRQFFVNLNNMIRPMSIYSGADITENIKIYLQQNLSKDITQDFIASLFYLNRSYLSHVFKERTGQKFIDYLNSLRIEKAKELLTTTNQKLYTIAKAVGYDNVKYFFRVFKKYTGMTPENYRQKYRIVDV